MLLNDTTSQKAVETGTAQTSSEQNYLIPLTRITKNVNPRQEPANLAAIGYSLLNDEDQEHSLMHMVFSSDIEMVRAAVELFEVHEGIDEESTPKADLSDVTPKEIRGVRQSVCALADDININGQLESAAVSYIDGKNYTLVFGQRRVAAILYAHACNLVALADGDEQPFANIGPVVSAKVVNADDDDALYFLAASENLQRKNFDEIQEGAVFYELTKRVNPETGKKWNLRQIAEHYGLNYGHVRNRHALACPYKADKVDEEGNITKKGKGLTDEEREMIRSGRKTTTWGVRKSLREEHYSDGAPRKNRDRAIPLSKMYELFDATSDDANDPVAVARRTAIAECMNKTLSQATKESKKRIKQAEKSEAA